MGLLLEREGGFDALGAYRSGDVEPIVRVFSEAASVATSNGRILTGDLLQARAGDVLDALDSFAERMSRRRW